MGIETELKLKADPSTLKRLRRLPLVQKLKTARPRTVRQLSVYFDTPDMILLRNRVALRIRHIGERRIQTVKSYGPSIWARGEWESEISGDTPRLDLIDPQESGASFADAALEKALAPVFATDVQRSVYHLDDGGSVMELALDEGTITAGGTRSEICEAEIELLSGSPDSLFRLASSLLDELPLRLAGLSKADRGYALCGGISATSRKSEPVSLDEATASSAAFQAIARSCLTQMLINQDCLEMLGAPEAVHQMRVGLRRLRSAISLFGSMLGDPQTESLRQDLRWLQGHLGPARDTDVFIQEILTPLAPHFAGNASFGAMETLFAKEREAHYAIARQVLKLPRYAKLMLALGAWAEGGDWLALPGKAAELRSALIGKTAAVILSKRDAKARKDLRHLRRLDPHTRHLGRISVKKLRYAAEFFASLYPAAEVKSAVQLLGRLQDTLGYLNDIAVAEDVLKDRSESLGTADAAWTAGMIAGWHRARMPELLNAAARDVKRFDKSTRPWHADSAGR